MTQRLDASSQKTALLLANASNGSRESMIPLPFARLVASQIDLTGIGQSRLSLVLAGPTANLRLSRREGT
jgi:hypothetical protein